MKENPTLLEDFSNKVQHKTEKISEKEIAAIQSEERAEAKAAGVELDEPDMTEQIMDVQTEGE